MVPAGVLSVLVTASTGAANRNLRRTQAAFRATAMVANKSSASTAASWKTAGGAVAATAAVITAASGKMAIDFEKDMRNVNSIAQLPEPAFKRINKEVLALAGPTAQAPGTLAKGLYTLVSSGFDAADATHVLEKSAYAATAGLSTTEVSVKAVAAVLNAYRQPASKAQDVSDTLFRTVDRGVISFEELAMNIGDTLPFASTLGVSLTELGASIATLTKQGLSPSETMTRIRNVLQTLIKPGETLTETFKALGMSGEEMIAKFGLQGTLDRLIGTLGVTKKELANLSGKSLDELANDTSQAKDEVAKLFPNIRALGGALGLTGINSEEAAKNLKLVGDATKGAGATALALSQQTKSVAYQWQQAKAEFAATAIELGNALLPVAIDLIGVLKSLFSTGVDLIHAFGDLPDPIRNAVLAMTALLVVSKLVQSAFVMGLIGSIVGAVAAIGKFVVGTVTLITHLGLLRGALLAVGIAAAANPIGAAVLGIGAAVAGVGLLTGAFGDLFDKEEKLTGLQKRLADTSSRLTHELEQEKDAVATLAGEAGKVRRAKDREHEASRRVVRAEKDLATVRSEYPATSRPVLMAEARLAEAKRKELQATRRLERAERERGALRRASKPEIREAAGAAKDRLTTLKDERSQLMKTLRAELKYGNNTEETTAKIRANSEEMKEARKAWSGIIRDATERIGPKFAKQLEKMTTAELMFGREAKITARTLKDPFENTLFDINDTLGRSQREIGQLGGKFKNTQQTGSQAIDILGTDTSNMLSQLGVEGGGLSVKRKKRQAGGFAVGGHGVGDKVPVNLMLEPGETGFILNKHATKEINALKEANSRWGRWHMAKGGEVPQGGFPDAMGALPGLDALAWVLRKKFGLGVVSGLRPGAITTSGNPSDHGWGGAIDVSNGYATPQMDAAHRWLQQNLGNAIKQMLYRTMIGGNHFDHIHVALQEQFARSASAVMNAIGGDFAGIGQLDRVLINGPESRLKDMAQGASDKVWKAAKAYIESKMPRYGPGRGDDLSIGNLTGPGKTVGASVYGFGEAGTGTVGSSGADLRGRNAYAELGMGTLLGGLPYGHRLKITAPTGRKAVGEKLDIGLGGGDVQGKTRAIDLWRDLAEALGLGGNFTGLVKVQGLQGGGEVGKDAIQKIRRIQGRTAKLDELIDVTGRIAQMAKSPAGTELSAGERDKLIKLNFSLMAALKKQRDIARRGLARVRKAIPEKVKGKTTREIEQSIAKLEKELDNTPNKAESKRRQLRDRITNLKEDLRSLNRQGGSREKLRERMSTLRDVLHEMQGVTGRGGRIFDTHETIQELKNTATGLFGGGITIDQLLEFAQAARYGAFASKGLPAFRNGGLHSGGWAMVGEGGRELARMPAGTQVYNNRDTEAMLHPNVEVHHHWGDGMEWLEQFVDTRVKVNGKEVDGAWRAGRAKK